MFFNPRNGRSRTTESPAPITDDDIAKELERAARAYRLSQRSRSRFRIRTYLKDVYRLYRRWNENGEVKRLVRTAVSLSDFHIRHGAHPLKVLIDLTCTEPDPKQRSRWAAALRYADVQSVHPEALRSFIERHGGIAAVARLGAKSRRWD
jgi:hypothetical protein